MISCPKTDASVLYLLTGATGSLGGHIAALLAGKDSVAMVYCLVRDDRISTHRVRVMNKLCESGLTVSRTTTFDEDGEEVEEEDNEGVYTTDPETHKYPEYICTPTQFEKIVVYPSDLTDEKLGLTSDQYTNIRNTVTHVIHCAWTVNYNIELRSFEHLIRGSRNLISLCLKSDSVKPASFHFISSTAASPDEPVKEVHYDISQAGGIGLGYGQSKFVVEQLCKIATEKVSTMVAHVLRLGYISGESMPGHWESSKDEHPLIVASASTTKTLPKPPNDEKLSWLPVNDAAKVCIELVLGASDAPRAAVFNVAQSEFISWNDDVLPRVTDAHTWITAEPPSDWLEKLKLVLPVNPLLRYFQAKYGSDDVLQLEIHTTEAKKYSPCLAACKPVDGEVIDKYVKSWKMDEKWNEYKVAEARANAEE